MSAKMYQSPMGLSISWLNSTMAFFFRYSGAYDDRNDAGSERGKGRGPTTTSARLTGNHTIDQTSYTVVFHLHPHHCIFNVEHHRVQKDNYIPAGHPAKPQKCATPTSSSPSLPSSSLLSQVLPLSPHTPTAPQTQLTSLSSLGQDRPLLRRLPHQHPALHARLPPRPPPRLVHHRQEP